MTKVNGFFAGNIKPTEVIGGCIAIYRDLWPNTEETIQMAESVSTSQNISAYWEKAETVGDGVNQTHRVNQIMAVSKHAEHSDDPLLQNIHNQFYTMLLATTIPYAEQFEIAERLFYEDYWMLKYSGGDHYKSHYDGSTSLGRAISAICYLNDDYEGGEIEFTNFGITIKPEKGTLILFPSNYAYKHIAHPVTKGTKYALVTWIRDQDNF